MNFAPPSLFEAFPQEGAASSEVILRSTHLECGVDDNPAAAPRVRGACFRVRIFYENDDLVFPGRCSGAESEIELEVVGGDTGDEIHRSIVDDVGLKWTWTYDCNESLIDSEFPPTRIGTYQHEAALQEVLPEARSIEGGDRGRTS